MDMGNGGLLKRMEDYGADMTGAMERFMDDEELYGKCLELFVADKNFETLGEELRQEDFQKAFNAAHTLKGVAANLGLTPMLTALTEIVEPLRGGNGGEFSAQYEEILSQLTKLKELM